MKLFGITIMGALLTLLRMLTGFIVAKFVAVYAGPSGVAMLGQLQSFVTGLNGLIANQIGQGVVRFSAENKNDGYEACQPWWSAAANLLLFTVASSFFLLAVLSKQISLWLFNNEGYFWIVLIVGFCLPLNAINSLLLNVLNGLGQNRKNILTGFIAVLVTTIFSVAFLIFWGLNGGLLAVAINNAVAAGIVIWRVREEPWFRIKYWFGSFDSSNRKILVGYMLMGVVGAMTGPMALITVRNILSDSISLDAAGLWQAVTRISDAYIAMLTIGIGMYYFPKASAIKSAVVLKRETWHVFRFTFPIIIVFTLMIFLFRDLIVNVLYSSEFLPASELFIPQLVGDLFRVLSFIPASVIMAKGYFKINAAAEVGINLLFVALTYTMLNRFGVISANIAYAVSYVGYFLFSCVFFKYHCKLLDEKQ